MTSYGRGWRTGSQLLTQTVNKASGAQGGSVPGPAFPSPTSLTLYYWDISEPVRLQTAMYPSLKRRELPGTLYQQVICIFNASSITVVQVESLCDKKVSVENQSSTLSAKSQETRTLFPCSRHQQPDRLNPGSSPL